MTAPEQPVVRERATKFYRPLRRCSECRNWPAQPHDVMCGYCRIYRFPRKLSDAERAQVPF